MKYTLLLITVFICFSLHAQVGVNTLTPEAALDINATDSGVLIPRVALTGNNDIATVTNPQGGGLAVSTLVFNTTAVTGANALPEGFVYWDGMFWIAVGSGTARGENGLNDTSGDIRLGGSLLETTTITNETFGLNINLNATGNFSIQDNGLNHFTVFNNGDTHFGGDVVWRDETTSGTILASLIDDANDGRFTIRENGGISVDLDANTQFVFNDLGLDRNFRVESNLNSNMFFVDAGQNRVGIGTNNPLETLHVVGDILLTGGLRNIEIQAGDQNIQLDDSNPTWNGNVYGGVTRFFGDGNLAGSKLEAGGLQLERNIQIRGGNPGFGRVLTSDAVGNATWEVPSDGDITAVNAGPGLQGGGTTGNVTLSASANNGLYVNAGADRIRLGGTLLENTTINQTAFDFNFDLTGAGDFNIQDLGINHFSVFDNGNSAFGGDVEWRDGFTGGILLASLVDDGSDGRFTVRENGVVSIDLDANTQSVFNEQGLNRDFRIESDVRLAMLLVDASENLVRFGTNDTNSDSQNGNVVDGITVDYVADFDRGTITGTAVGIGSIEYLLDGSSEIIINTQYSPSQHLGYDLGESTTERAWDDVFADNYVNVSDRREKKNIENISYGLAEVLKMRPVSYILKQDPFQETKLGLIAQEALALVPESVKTHDYKILSEDTPDKFTKVEMERMGMTYNSLIPVLIKATQEQQKLIDSQQDMFTKQQKEIEELKKMVQQLLEEKN